MQYLTIQRKEGNRTKELNIVSLQQVVGKHIKLSIKGALRSFLLQKAEEHPNNIRINMENIFHVFDANRVDITTSGNRRSPWILIVGQKGVRKKIELLLIGPRIWGIEMDMGMKMRVNAYKLGYDRLINFLRNQVSSMIETPERWESVEIFLNK